MAIDSEPERRSASSLLPWSGPGVTPDASLDEDWRQAVGNSYVGIDYQLADQITSNSIVSRVAGLISTTVLRA